MYILSFVDKLLMIIIIELYLVNKYNNDNHCQLTKILPSHYINIICIVIGVQ